MLFGLFYYDWTILLVIPAFIFSLWAQYSVQSTYKKYSQTPARCGMTGYDAARKILDDNGLRNIRIEHISGELTDHYDPKARVIRLSDAVHDSKSAAAIGVAAHEAGHAVQYAQEYFPMKLRALIIPATKIGSFLAIPLFVIGLIMASDGLMLAGIVLYCAIAFFQLVTLPVEFNASKRAMECLAGYRYMTDEDLTAARKVLTAAAMTYVAALATTLTTLLRLLLLAGGGRRRD